MIIFVYVSWSIILRYSLECKSKIRIARLYRMQIFKELNYPTQWMTEYMSVFSLYIVTDIRIEDLFFPKTGGYGVFWF